MTAGLVAPAVGSSSAVRRCAALLVLALGLLAGATPAQAGLFEDEDARRYMLELNGRVEAQRKTMADALRRMEDENSQLRRSLLELQNQIEALRTEQARMTGQNEQLAKEVADMQRRQKDLSQGVDDRLRRVEPSKVTLDGREFAAQPAETRDFDAALAIFKAGDFAAAQAPWVQFIKRYPQSGYAPSALFWLGNAQYATRNYKEAVTNFRELLDIAPTHARAPEAMLSIANCQVELKDKRAARKTLEDLQKAFPQSEAALAARDRLLSLK